MPNKIKELQEMIYSRDISFYQKGKLIDLSPLLESDIHTFLLQKYPVAFMHEVAEFLVNQSGEAISVKGPGLELLLSEREEVDAMAYFISDIVEEGSEAKKTMRIHLMANLENIHLKEPHFEEFDMMFELPISKWAPEMHPVEKELYLTLCQQFENTYAEFSFPDSEAQFLHAAAFLAKHCMVGTLAQLERYRSYARKKEDLRNGIIEALNLFAPVIPIMN